MQILGAHKSISTMLHLKHFYQLLKKSVNAWVDDYAPSMGAAISYYTVFSIAPLLLIVIAVAGFVWGRDAVQGEIVNQLSGLIGQDGAAGIQALIKSANKPAQGLIATAISVGVLIVGATTVFAELQSALDRVWDVSGVKKGSGIWSTLRARVLSLGFILGLGFLLSVSLVFSAGVAAVGGWANGLFPGWELLLQALNTLLSLTVATVLFAMIFKLMPQAKVSWRDVWVGAFVTAVLFEIGKALIGLYIGKSGVTSSFAAAGSLVVLLVWVYYSAQIFLLGAEFTWAYAHDHGSLKGKETAGNPSPKESASALKTPDSNLPAKVVPEVPRHSASPATSISPMLPDMSRKTKSPIAITKVSAVAQGDKPLGRPTIKQRAVVYAATTAAYMALRLLLKRRPLPPRPAR